MSTTDPATANVQYHLFTSDHVTLYCKFSCCYGVNVQKKPQYNIHDQLDPSSSNFKAEIYDAIFHYGARSDTGEQFKICIATQDMKDAAWKYVHCSQLVLDGTFLEFVQHNFYSSLHQAKTMMGKVSRLHFFFSQLQQEARPLTWGITQKSYGNYSCIGRLPWDPSSLWTLAQKCSCHMLQLLTQTQRSMAHVFYFAIFTLNNAGQTTEKQFSDRKEMNTGETGF